MPRRQRSFKNRAMPLVRAMPQDSTAFTATRSLRRTSGGVAADNDKAEWNRVGNRVGEQ
jgi:hypothetical protein